MASAPSLPRGSRSRWWQAAAVASVVWQLRAAAQELTGALPGGGTPISVFAQPPPPPQSPPAPPGSLESLIPETEERIVGGWPAKPGRYPYMVFLSGGGFICGGTLIASDVVLTAGHCTGFTAAYVSIYDVANDSPDQYEMHKVAEDVPHPSYQFVTVPDHDFRLLRLATHSSRGPVQLDGGSVFSEMQLGDDFLTMGWGSTTAYNPKASPILLETGVGYVPYNNPMCYAGYNYVNEAMMCAFSAGQDACNGDSGGPLIRPGEAPELDIQVGVVSWGQSCASPDFAGVYARVSAAIGWIDETLSGWGSPRLQPPGSSPPTPSAPSPQTPAAPLDPPVAQEDEQLMVSSQCCGDMRWFRDKAGAGAVCSATNYRAEATGGSLSGLPCTYDVSHADAQVVCEGSGARLCSIQEIQAGELFNTGCLVNFRRAWSSTPCSPEGDPAGQQGFYTAKGSGWGQVCQSATSPAAMVACCADAC